MGILDTIYVVSTGEFAFLPLVLSPALAAGFIYLLWKHRGVDIPLLTRVLLWFYHLIWTFIFLSAFTDDYHSVLGFEIGSVFLVLPLIILSVPLLLIIIVVTTLSSHNANPGGPILTTESRVPSFSWENIRASAPGYLVGLLVGFLAWRGASEIIFYRLLHPYVRLLIPFFSSDLTWLAILFIIFILCLFPFLLPFRRFKWGYLAGLLPVLLYATVRSLAGVF